MPRCKRINGSVLWQEICKDAGGEDILRRKQGLLESTLRHTVLDAEQGTCSAPCAVLDERSERIAYATQGFKDLVACVGADSDSVLGQTFRECLQPKNTALDQVVNADSWDQLHNFAELAELGTSVILLMLGTNRDGKLFWNMVHAFHVCTPSFGIRMLNVVTVLEVPLPRMIGQASAEGASDDDLAFLGSFVSRTNEDVHVQVASAEVETISVISQRTERACKALAGPIDGSFEGDHFVPMVGYESVKAFNSMNAWEAVFGQVEQELKTAWEADDEVYRNTKAGGAKAIACAVADPSVDDCPLVYISPGFESLTQYRRTWALGRNCRFLQPNKRIKNKEFNGDEINRMKVFCTHARSRHIVNLLLNEAADGKHFWNLLFMEHIKYAEGGRSSHYIFGVQSNIIIQKSLLDRFVLDVWESGTGKENLMKLREAFRFKEAAYSPKEASLVKLGGEVISSWAVEVGRQESSFWEGSLYVPLVGQPAVEEFAGMWPSLVERACRGIRTLFELSDATCGSIKNNADDAFACAVSDPTGIDCPLVFLTKGFENMTGYRNDFALGRNCRFLQPNTPDLNTAINGDELGRMRMFCKQPGSEGRTMLNLLLNERRSGERFWNLLHMEHIQVHGKPYILGVQTILDLPMPLILKDRDTSDGLWTYDPAVLACFVEELSFFLKQLRVQLRGTSSTCMRETIGYASASLATFMKRNCDDFEGDHLVPRYGREEAWISELDATWKRMLHRVRHVLVEIWGTSEYNGEDVACAVSDPMGKDCPLVYVSPRFETMTGYPREWALGRNCRFLQPNDSRRNMQFNEDDKLRMRAFCSKPHLQGTRIINLLVNESKDGYPFWNVLVMEHLEVRGVQYIFGIQSGIDIEAAKMSEILAMDRDGLSELTRLRNLLRSKETCLGKRSFKTIVDEVIRKWVSDFPIHLHMPRLKASGVRDYTSGVDLPMAALVITPEQPLSNTLQQGIEHGIRHFAFALQSGDYSEDSQYVERVGHLFSLQLADALTHMRFTYMHYLRAGMAFTLITRPQYVSCFRGINKAVIPCGYCFHCWLLDVRGITGDKIMLPGVAARLCECYQAMSGARKAGDVKVIGLYGTLVSVMAVMELLKKHRTESPVGVLALDDSPGREIDQSRLNRFRKLYVNDYGSPLMATYSLYGASNSLLDAVALQDRARRLHTDLPTMLLKWAESKNLLAFVPKIRDAADKMAVRDCPDFHRTFLRNYAAGPSPRHVAMEVTLAIEENAVPAARDSSRRSSTASHLVARRSSRNISELATSARTTSDLAVPSLSHLPHGSGSGRQHSKRASAVGRLLTPRASVPATLHLDSRRSNPDGLGSGREGMEVKAQTFEVPSCAEIEQSSLRSQQTSALRPSLLPDLWQSESVASMGQDAGCSDSEPEAQLPLKHVQTTPVDNSDSESEIQSKARTPLPPMQPRRPRRPRRLDRLYPPLVLPQNANQSEGQAGEPHQPQPQRSTRITRIPSHSTSDSATSEPDYVRTDVERTESMPVVHSRTPCVPLDERTRHLAEKLRKKGWSIEDAAEFLECGMDQLVHVWKMDPTSMLIGG